MKKILVVVVMLALNACHQQEVLPRQTRTKGLTLNDLRVLILVDGKKTTSANLQAIDPSTIEAVEVIKGADVKKYTAQKYEGVIKISLKKS